MASARLLENRRWYSFSAAATSWATVSRWAIDCALGAGGWVAAETGFATAHDRATAKGTRTITRLNGTVISVLLTNGRHGTRRPSASECYDTRRHRDEHRSSPCRFSTSATTSTSACTSYRAAMCR